MEDLEPTSLDYLALSAGLKAVMKHYDVTEEEARELLVGNDGKWLSRLPERVFNEFYL